MGVYECEQCGTEEIITVPRGQKKPPCKSCGGNLCRQSENENIIKICKIADKQLSIYMSGQNQITVYLGATTYHNTWASVLKHINGDIRSMNISKSNNLRELVVAEKLTSALIERLADEIVEKINGVKYEAGIH